VSAVGQRASISLSPASLNSLFRFVDSVSCALPTARNCYDLPLFRPDGVLARNKKPGAFTRVVPDCWT